MRNHKHRIRINRGSYSDLIPDDLRPKVHNAVLGAETGSEVHIEVCKDDLLKLPFILEPLPDYDWVFWHEDKASLDLGLYLFPPSPETEGKTS
jgi:hypothetical protein